eukprot:1181366-Pyramimonas_sp.AAC.1
MALSSSSVGDSGLSSELIFCNIVACVSRMRGEVDLVGPSTRSLYTPTSLGWFRLPCSSTFTEVLALAPTSSTWSTVHNPELSANNS